MELLTIIGATATGKTTLAAAIAQRVDGEIVSADSRQIYRHMAIGTAQPTAEQRALVPFHLIDFVDPGDDYSCGQFARDAEAIIGDIVTRRRVPIICGGTGLYIRALFDPLHPLPRSDPRVKKRLVRDLEETGIDALYQRLRECDPEWAEKVGPHDTQRILRGLEVNALTGMPLSVLIDGDKRVPRYRPRYVGLQLPRAELYKRINERFDSMLGQGFVDEVRTLLEKKYDPSCNALRTIGYREMIQHLQGTKSLEDAVSQAKMHTRQFAKRQMTWFHKLPAVDWHDTRDPRIAEYLATWVKDPGRGEMSIS